MVGIVEVGITGRDRIVGCIHAYLETGVGDHSIHEPHWVETTFDTDGSIIRESDKLRDKITDRLSNGRDVSEHDYVRLCNANANGIDSLFEEMLSQIAKENNVRLECRYWKKDGSLYVTFCNNKEFVNSLTLEDLEAILLK